MAQTTSVLIIGATGYLGGTIFLRFLDSPGFKDGSTKLTVLVRNTDYAEKFKSMGVEVAVGSIADEELITRLSAAADVVLSMAVVNDVPGLTYALRGAKKRFETTGRTPVLVHVSGASLVIDYAHGMYASDTIYSDKDLTQLEEVLARPTQFHSGVYYLLDEADKQGYVRTYIVVPSYVSGVVKNKLTELDMQNTLCTSISLMTRAALGRGQAAIIGEGKNIFGFVDNEEHADLFMLLYDAAVNRPESCGHGREGVYFASSGEIPWREFNEAVGEGLFQAGKASTPAVSTLTPEEEEKFLPFPMAGVFGSNVRVSSDRAYDLGWKPKRTLEEVKASITAEVLQFLKQSRIRFRPRAALLIESNDDETYLKTLKPESG